MEHRRGEALDLDRLFREHYGNPEVPPNRITNSKINRLSGPEDHDSESIHTSSSEDGQAASLRVPLSQAGALAVRHRQMQVIIISTDTISLSQPENMSS